MNNAKGKPEMVILDTFEDDYIEEHQRNICRSIGTHTSDISKLRDFDCIFVSKKKSSAKELCLFLSKHLGYITDNPFRDENAWITNAVKQIPFSGLSTEIKMANKVAEKYSSDLVDWMFECDTMPELSSE